MPLKEISAKLGFNPFQGIQVLSGIPQPAHCRGCGIVSIPFREFKCCRAKQNSICMLFWRDVSIPFREFKCCRDESTVEVDRNDIEDLERRFNPFQGIQVLSAFSILL